MKLETYIKKHGSSKETFAKKIGVTVTTINRYIACTRFPKLEIIQKITKATKGKVTANDFMPEN